MTTLIYVTVTLLIISGAALMLYLTSGDTRPLTVIDVIANPNHTPRKAHWQDAGFDVKTTQPIFLRPGERKLAPTGVRIDVPTGVVCDVRPRSGLATKLGVTVMNAPGTVDPGYTGEIMVNLVNLGDQAVSLKAGERIGQLVFLPTLNVQFNHVNSFPTHARGTKGHGSTGK